MMIQPAIIRKCSTCADFMYVRTKSNRLVPTGYGWAVSFWTDGKIAIGSSLVDPQLVACPHCSSLHWACALDNCGEVVCAEQMFNETRKVMLAKVPSFKDYKSIIEAGSKAEIRYARICLMWRYNDTRRRETSKAPRPLFHETSNLKSLAELLDEDDANHRVMKAEVMRELGHFDEAQTLLESLGSDCSHLIKAIKGLAKKGDTRVMEVAL